MALYDDIFNKAYIYDILFLNVKAVLEYPTLLDLKENNPVMYERWKLLLKIKYNINFDNDVNQSSKYLETAVQYPEFTKIVAITYGKLEWEDNKMKRFIKKIVNKYDKETDCIVGDELSIIEVFMDDLNQYSNEGMRFPILCGHNIINYDIPLLLKRFILYRNKLNISKEIPRILINCLNAKPWESSTVVDTINIWKFNGNDYMPLILIADFLGLKKAVDIDTLSDFSKYYWDNISIDPDQTLAYCGLQSATQTNLVIQLMNELRQLQ